MPSKKKIVKCPKGGNSDNIIDILYGMPGYEAYQDSLEGKIWIGGCCVGNSSPKHYCKIHEIEF